MYPENRTYFIQDIKSKQVIFNKSVPFATASQLLFLIFFRKVFIVLHLGYLLLRGVVLVVIIRFVVIIAAVIALIIVLLFFGRLLVLRDLD